jgi:glycerol-3-phosphate acyltransferase PlsY
MAAIISIIIAYLLGSFSTSIILAKIMKLPDPRTQGSGSAGATNILRTMGRDKAILVLIGDVVKGLIAVLIGRIFGVHGVMLGFVALAAVIGHVFPLYFKFKGGKGVATAIGSIIMLNLWVGIVMIIAWILVAFFSRYASLASMIAVILAPICSLIFGSAHYAFPTLLIAILVIWKHMDNINRLRAGTENKIELKS